MPKVSKQYKAKKRELILESALKCFGEKGYQSASMDDIVATAKISKGLIYNYFKNKESLYLSLMQERTDRTFQLIHERFENLESPTQKIKLLFDMHKVRPLTKETRELINVHMEFWIHSNRDDKLRQIMIDRFKLRYRKLVMTVITEGILCGEFQNELDSEAAASLLWATVDGTALKYCITRDEEAYIKTLEIAEVIYLEYLKK